MKEADIKKSAFSLFPKGKKNVTNTLQYGYAFVKSVIFC